MTGTIMKRVPGDTDIYVGVYWPDKVIDVIGPGKQTRHLPPAESAELRDYLVLAEWQLEGVPGESLPARAPVTADASAGTITFDGATFSALQSEHLRALLERAEQALAAGYGWP